MLLGSEDELAVFDQNRDLEVMVNNLKKMLTHSQVAVNKFCVRDLY